MSCSFIVISLLLGSSVVIAFVLQPSREESTAPANPPVSPRRCQGESLQSIRKSLLSALNLQIEPRLPNGNYIKEQWRATFSSMAHRSRDAGAPAVPISPQGENSTGLRCCSLVSEVSMKELGWDSWVILPVSVTIVKCALCNPDGSIMQCPSSGASVQDADSQVPCCQLTSQDKVHVLYADEGGTIVMSSMKLPSSCGCGHANIQQPSGE